MPVGDGETDPAREEIQTPWLRGGRGEALVFVLLAVLIWPFIAVAIVGGYGFIVWISQIIAGPPGPPGGSSDGRSRYHRSQPSGLLARPAAWGWDAPTASAVGGQRLRGRLYALRCVY